MGIKVYMKILQFVNSLLFGKKRTLAIEVFCNHLNIVKYEVNDDYSIDVFSDVWLVNSNLKKIPITFNRIYGSFNCYSCVQLKTLDGFPKYIYGKFDMPDNISLKSLKGLPLFVGGYVNLEGSFNLVNSNENCEILERCEILGGVFLPNKFNIFYKIFKRSSTIQQMLNE